MATEQEKREIAHKITLNQLAEAERLKSAYQEPNLDKRYPFKTVGEVYAHNYLQMITTNHERKEYNRTKNYQLAKTLGVVCSNCGSEELKQYRGGRDRYYFECRDCNHRFQVKKE